MTHYNNSYIASGLALNWVQIFAYYVCIKEFELGIYLYFKKLHGRTIDKNEWFSAVHYIENRSCEKGIVTKNFTDHRCFLQIFFWAEKKHTILFYDSVPATIFLPFTIFSFWSNNFSQTFQVEIFFAWTFSLISLSL